MIMNSINKNGCTTCKPGKEQFRDLKAIVMNSTSKYLLIFEYSSTFEVLSRGRAVVSLLL